MKKIVALLALFGLGSTIAAGYTDMKRSNTKNFELLCTAAGKPLNSYSILTLDGLTEISVCNQFEIMRVKIVFKGLVHTLADVNLLAPPLTGCIPTNTSASTTTFSCVANPETRGSTYIFPTENEIQSIKMLLF